MIASRPVPRAATAADPAVLPPISVTLRGLAGGELPPGALASASFRLGAGEGPAADPVALLEAGRAVGLDTALWLQPAAGFSIVGIGRAWEASAAGPDRFGAMEAAWTSLLASARLHGGPDSGDRGPLLVGGLGFTGERPADDRWAPFGPASLVLPELIVVGTPEGRWLTALLVGSRPAGGPEGNGSHPEVGASATPEQLEARWASLLDGVPRTASPAASSAHDQATRATLAATSSRPDRPTWDRLVGRFAGAVGRGRIDKVVLARRLDLESSIEIDVAGALRRLAEAAPESTVYAFSRGSSVFLGATPERLVLTEAGTFRTMAVAGSIGRGTTPEEDVALAARLLASDKDREEHAVVVAMLRAALEPLATELQVAPAPQVVPFRTVQHLVTGIAGRLRERSGILALAGRLHPTPAVGGEPRDLALALIAEHEGFERGWYAGPIGWLGPDGDGELAVALRCGLVDGQSASLFAGCGIVADSDPEREWEESELKLRVVAQALGELRS